MRDHNYVCAGHSLVISSAPSRRPPERFLHLLGNDRRAPQNHASVIHPTGSKEGKGTMSIASPTLAMAILVSRRARTPPQIRFRPCPRLAPSSFLVRSDSGLRGDEIWPSPLLSLPYSLSLSPSLSLSLSSSIFSLSTAQTDNVVWAGRYSRTFLAATARITLHSVFRAYLNLRIASSVQSIPRKIPPSQSNDPFFSRRRLMLLFSLHCVLNGRQK